MLIIRQIALLCLVTLKKYFQTITFVFRSILKLSRSVSTGRSVVVSRFFFFDSMMLRRFSWVIGGRWVIGRCWASVVAARHQRPPGSGRRHRLGFARVDQIGCRFFLFRSVVVSFFYSVFTAFELWSCGSDRSRAVWCDEA